MGARSAVIAVGFAAVLVVGACGARPTPPTSTSATTTSSAATPTTSAPSDACTSGDLAFATSGLIAALGTDAGNATEVRGIRWAAASECERLIIDLSNEAGAPAATLGATGVSVLDLPGIVRVALPAETSSTAIADTLFEGDLIDRAYVVRGEDGSLTIDIITAENAPIAARAFATASPAAIVIDVRANSDSAPPVGIARSPRAVVVNPSPGPGLYPFSVDGYAAPGLRSVNLQLSVDGVTTDDRAIALDGGTDAWQAIRAEVLDGPAGAVTLFVGSVDPNGRPLDGARISLDLP